MRSDRIRPPDRPGSARRRKGWNRPWAGRAGSIAGSLVALAIVARVAAVWVLQSHHVPRSTYEHGEIAANLLAGRGFAMQFLGADGPTSQQAPIYPALVASRTRSGASRRRKPCCSWS